MHVHTQVEATQEMTRIVGLSATLPNYEDVGDFLRCVCVCTYVCVHVCLRVCGTVGLQARLSCLLRCLAS